MEACLALRGEGRVCVCVRAGRQKEEERQKRVRAEQSKQATHEGLIPNSNNVASKQATDVCEFMFPRWKPRRWSPTPVQLTTPRPSSVCIREAWKSPLCWPERLINLVYYSLNQNCVGVVLGKLLCGRAHKILWTESSSLGLYPASPNEMGTSLSPMVLTQQAM